MPLLSFPQRGTTQQLQLFHKHEKVTIKRKVFNDCAGKVHKFEKVENTGDNTTSLDEFVKNF